MKEDMRGPGWVIVYNCPDFKSARRRLTELLGDKIPTVHLEHIAALNRARRGRKNQDLFAPKVFRVSDGMRIP